MTPKLRGLGEKLKKLKHNVAADAEALDARIDQTDVRRQDVFAKTHRAIEGTHANLDEMNEFLDDIEGSNSGDPIQRDSANGSEASRSSEIATKR